MGRFRLSAALVLVALILASCAPTGGGAGGAPAQPSSQQVQSNKTLVVLTRAEPPSLAGRPIRQLGLTQDLSRRMFNAFLTIRNDAGAPTAYLAEAVPQLNTDTWRVNPDGTMETTYRLKPNTTWHDGTPLTTQDFVFGYEVYSRPEFGLAASPPLRMMSGVDAPDPRTLVIHWNQTFGQADGSGSETTVSAVLCALPRHILAQDFQTQDSEAFAAHSYWTQSYVGAGPYKLDRWEVGAFLEGVAFDGDVYGKPKISRIREVFIADPNTVVANLLAGEGQLTSGDSIRFNDGEILRQQWSDRGRILNFPNLVRHVQFQRRPEFASTLAFGDLRVRQALQHGIDFDTLNEVLSAGRTTPAVGPIAPTASYFKDLDQAVAHYPYDPRRTDQLMTEAGFAKGADGIWASPTPRFGRMSFEINVLGSPDSDNEMHLNADSWRKLGFDVKEISWAPALGADDQVRNTFPGLSTTSEPPGEAAFGYYRTDRIPTAEKRWNGRNRGAWPGTPEFDRWVDVFETSLERPQRTQAVIQMSRIFTEDVVVIQLYWKLNAQAAINELTGPRLTDPDGTAEWNISEWELK